MDEEKMIRLDQTRKVFKVLADLIQTKETCSYRYLIYDLLGFEGYAYTMLLDGLAITNHLVEYEELENKLKSMQASPENYEYHNRIAKAIDYLEELISDTKGMIDNYNNEDKEQTIKRFIEDLKTDLEHYKYLQLLLRGEDNGK